MQLDELKKLQQQVVEQATSMESSVTHEIREVETSVNQTLTNQTIQTIAPSPEPEIAVSPAPTFADTTVPPVKT